MTEAAYFFLSYAHSPPTSVVPVRAAPPAPTSLHSAADRAARVFFDDLASAVGSIAEAGSRLLPGYYDGLLPAGTDPEARTAAALGAAETFVALYAPAYFELAWPRQERDAFLARMAAFPAHKDRQRVVPVLWVPLPGWADVPELDDALELGDGVPEYRRFGLFALYAQSSYRRQYMTILHRLTRRVVDLAENAPVGPSPAEFGPPPAPFYRVAPFIIAVLSDGGVDWRPYPLEQSDPAARSVAARAERAGLPVEIVLLTERASLLDANPGAILIDAAALGQARVAELDLVREYRREWVTTWIVGPRGDRVDGASDILPEVEWISSAAEFERRIPELVDRGFRHFLEYGPTFPPKGPPGEHPRLFGPDKTGTEERG